MSKAQIQLSAVDQTKAAFDSAKRNLQGLSGQLSSMPAKFGSLGLAIAGVFSAATLKGAVDMLDKLDDLSEKTGISVENLSALRYAGEVTGTSLESIATSVKKLSVNMAEAASGNKEAVATFKSIGVEVKNSDGSLRSQDAVLGDIADRFASYADGAGKSALAQKIFGKAGAEMIPLLNQGSEGIARLRKEAEGLGLVYGGELAKQAAEFNDNLKKLELNAEAAKVSLAGGLLPALNKIIEAFIRMKAAGQIWTVMKDAAKDVVGMGRLTDDPGKDIARLTAERGRKQRDIDFATRRGLPTRDLQDDIFQTDELIEASKVRQAGRALAGSGDTSDAMSRRMRGAKGRTAPSVSSDDSAAKAANKVLAEEAKLLAELSGVTASYNEDLSTLQSLRAKGKLNDEQYVELITALINKQPGIKAVTDAEARLGEIREKNAQSSLKHLDALAAENDQLLKSNQTLFEEVEQLGLSAEALNVLRLARMDSNIAREEEQLISDKSNGINEDEIALREQNIRLLRQERNLKAEGAVKEIRAADVEENKRRSEGISASISEGLLDGFRDGRSLGDIFLNELKAQFAKTVLQPIISPIVQAGNSALTSALSGGGGLGGIFGSLAGSFGQYGGSSNIATAGNYVNSMDAMSDAAGGGIFGSIGNFFSGLSLDGGGYTGDGVRAGGLDGKGGFMAMMHPRETVIDHTKGQRLGGSTTMVTNNYYGHNVSRGEVLAASQQAVAQSRQDRMEDSRRRRG